MPSAISLQSLPAKTPHSHSIISKIAQQLIFTRMFEAQIILCRHLYRREQL